MKDNTVLAVYARQGRPGPDALKEGARASGIRVVEQRPLAARPQDALIHGVRWVVLDGLQRDGAKIREAYRSVGVPVWIMELPRIRAGRASGQDKSHGLFLDSLHYLPPKVGNTAITRGVIEGRKPDYILVAGQKPNDTAHNMSPDECRRWSKEVIDLCRLQYGKPVVYRPHPQAVALVGAEESFGADQVSRPSQETLREALARAHSLVTYNSTSGVEAIDAGVPVFYTAPESECAYWQYAAPIGSKPRNLTKAEREACLLRFAACQWSVDQLKDGTAARCLFLGEEWPAPKMVQLSDDESLAEEVALLGLHDRQERQVMAWQRKTA